jgi:hypothetical protein
MFPTKAAPEKRAKELKCSGTFAMGSEWMPGKNFDTDEKAAWLQGVQADPRWRRRGISTQPNTLRLPAQRF